MADGTKKKQTRRLTKRERLFVKAKVQGKTNRVAYAEAGYAPMKQDSMDVVASRVHNKPHIQAAIDSALEAAGATPEWAVRQIVKVAEQDDELPAKRLASMNLLELHGWNKAERPTVQLDIRNAFFGGGRKTDEQTTVIEAEPEDNA